MPPAPRRARRTALVILALLAGALTFAPSPAAQPFCDVDLTTAPNCYVSVDDGTVIAMSVRIPADCRNGTRDCPTIFEMAGYENGSAEGLTTTGEFGGSSAPLSRDSRQLTEMFDGDYATVHASVRGTGCSGGEFDLFSLRSARDGVQLIEWVARQDWSNGKVGLMGHSYSGITGFMIASQRPAPLTAITVSGLIDDLYRGITYPGGVSNMGFPPLWTLGVRMAYDVLGGLAQGLGRPIWRNIPEMNPYDKTFTTGQSIQCATNLSTRGRTVINDPVLQGGLSDTDGTWWQARALATFADRINVPAHIAGSYQDEQTGPRGTTRLWEKIQGVPKRLMVANGNHGTNQSNYYFNDRRAWMDHWMLGQDNGFGAVADDQSTVQVLQEFKGRPNSVISDTRFPLSTTAWTDYFMQPDGTLAATAPPGNASGTYLSGSGRQSWNWQAGPTFGAPLTTADGPDEMTFKTAPMADDLTVAGPISATLRLSSTAPDTELFVQVIDEAPSGTRMYLQRGLLKASHRAIDLRQSDCVDAANIKTACTDDGVTLKSGAVLYRPHRPHTNPTLTTPGEANDYLVEIFPVGHVFRKDHRIMVKVMAPPLAESYYIYVPRTLRAVNTLFYGVSKVTLPVIPNAPVEPVARAECTLDNVRCIRKPNG